MPQNLSRLNLPFRNKAVSDGALSFYHDHFVRARISKFAYGHFYDPRFDPTDPDHQQRFDKTYTSIAGETCVRDVFSVILPKVYSFSFVVTALFIRLPRIRKFRR
jgi:hypothetical protein